MAHIFANGVLETASAPGTGAVTVTGAVLGYRTFGSKCAVGDTVHYRIEAVSGLGTPTGLWEVGRGTYSAANTLTRTTVLESSNSNALESFGGSIRVALTVLAPTTSTQVALDWITALGAVDTTNAQTIGGQKRFSANPSVGVAASAWGGVVPAAIDIGAGAALAANTDKTLYLSMNVYYTGSAWALKTTGAGSLFSYNGDGSGSILRAPSGTAGAAPSFAEVFKWDTSSLITLNGGGGTTTIRNKLFIGPTASTMATSDSSNSLELQNNGGTGDTNMSMMAFHCTGQYAIKIGCRPDGYFGIGGWSRAAWSVYTAPDGSWYCAGNVSAYSDERLKTNWRDLPKNYVARLAKQKSGVYDRIDHEKGYPLTQVGVGAQTLRKLLPWAITKGMDRKTLAVSYGPAALVSAVELAKDNVDLRQKLHEEGKARRALERKVDRMQKKFEKFMKEAMKK